MSIQTLALAFLAATAIGGLAWVFIYPSLSGQRKAESRRASIARADAAGASGREKPAFAPRAGRGIAEGTRRPPQEGEVRPAHHPPCPGRLGILDAPEILDRVGRFRRGRIRLAFVIGGHLLGAAVMAFGTGLGLPRWVLGFLKKRREKAFLKALPDAVDVIVRGIKAGLPLFESIKVVAADSPEPLKSEFNAIIETQTIGMPLGEACARLYERMPLPEANFFGIVIAIQQKSGGNLSEALGNLSKVLRDRKKMAEKIQAMSTEAKASAGIIGSLPPIVMLLVWISTPDYISLLWTHSLGQFMLLCCVGWMTIGVLVMKKMINFDF